MKNKKTILKSCCKGKGGPSVGSVIKEIPGTLKTMGQNITKGLDPAGLVGKGIRGIKNIGNKVYQNWENADKASQAADKARNERMINENFGSVENYKKTLEPLPKKTQILKNSVKNVAPKAMPLPAKVKTMPATIKRVSPSIPKGWDSKTYQNFKKANPKLEPTKEDTKRMQGAK